MKGHITVYFSLLLVVLFSLLCTTIESARLGGVRVRCQASSYLGLESVFADYSLPVAREYGLLMLDKSYGTDDTEEYLTYLSDYISYNAAANKELLVRGADFCQAQLEEVSLIEERIVSAEGGRVLEEEILAYMKYAAPAGLLEWVMEKLGLLEQAEVVTSIFDKLSELESQAAEVDLAIQRMHRGMEQIKEYKIDVDSAADSIKSGVEELEELYEAYEEVDMEAPEAEEELKLLQEAINVLERSIALQVQGLVQEHTMLLDYNQYVAVQKENYDTNTQLVGAKLAEMEQIFAEGKEQLDEDIRNAVETELSNIRTYSAGEGDYYEVIPGTQEINPNIAILEGNVQSLVPYMSGGIAGLSSVVDSCAAAMKSYSTEHMYLNYEDEAAKGTGVDVMTRVKKLLGNGLLGLVTENPAALSNSEFFPEQPYEELLTGYAYSEEELLEQLLINEYLLSRFGNLLEPAEDKVLAYELEYILAGKGTDRENLAAAAGELLLMRTGMNLIYLLGSEEKQAEAEALATLLVGFTGMHGIIKVTQLLILTVWAQAEGIADVRALFAGNRVPMTKDDMSWKLSLSGLMSLNSSNLPFETGEAEGLTYKDYLRLLLVKEERSTRNGRTMDLIEGFVKKEYDEGFSLGECVTELVIHTQFKAKPVFLKLPFTDIGGGNEEYQLEGFSSYTY